MTSWVRLLLLYGHVLLSGYALYVVLRTDLLVLRRRVATERLLRIHHKVARLLAALWVTGLAIIVLDLAPDLRQFLERPKLITKFACVSVLTLNAFVLRWFAFPRLTRDGALGRTETSLLLGAGAVSVASWLMAAFIGVAKPMAQWPLADALGLYAGVLALALVAAQIVGPARLRARRARTGHTALEEAAETLEMRLRH